MNRKIAAIVCLAVMLFSACSNDELQPNEFAVAEFEDQIDETIIFQANNLAYVATGLDATNIYRVDLLSGEKTFIFSTDGYNRKFIVSADEKFIAIGVHPLEPSVESPSRLELFDLTTNTKTVLKTGETFFEPFGFDAESNALLYGQYGYGGKVSKIDLTSGAEEMIFNGNAMVVSINPVTSDILMRASGQFFFTDWNGTVIGEPITGFEPRFFSPDGEEIIGSRGFIWDANSNYLEVVRYKIATGEVESLTGTETQGEFHATSMSPDQNLVLGLKYDSRKQFSNDLYVVNTVTLERKQLMSTRGREQGIGFFDSGRKVLFTAPEANPKILYGLNLD